MMRAGISDHSIPARKKIMEQKTKSIARVEAGYRNKINGRAVEILVEEACIIYEKQKAAMIEKNPESMRVLKAVGNQGGLYIARFDKKSKPDFEGVLNNGQAIIFDVKSTEQDKIKASALSEGQAAYLKRYHSMGAVSFILVWKFSGKRHWKQLIIMIVDFTMNKTQTLSSKFLLFQWRIGYR